MQSLAEKSMFLSLLLGNSFVMGYYEYRNIWTPKEKEILQAEMEPKHKMVKFAVSVVKDKKTIGYLAKRKNREILNDHLFL